MDSLRQNLTFAWRQLSRDRGFTVTVIITLALSIGVNTAIFSVVNALVLKSLPYSHPEQIGAIYARTIGRGASVERAGIDGNKWELLRDHVPAVIAAVSGSTSGVNLQAGARAQYVREGRISANFLTVLELQPMIGRSFSAEEDRPHGPEAAILSYGLWQNVFNGDRAILGQSVRLKGEPYTVIGVLPEGAITPSNADLYTALQPSHEGEGGGTNFDAIVRLRNGATWQAADAQINRAWSAAVQSFAKSRPGESVSYYSVPLQKAETDTLLPQVLVLMLAAGFILLIACTNLAGLMLVRMLRRTSEVATRLALGATPWDIQKQFWIETMMLALGGGAAAMGVGVLALRCLLGLLPENFLPVASVSLDGRVLIFTLSLSLLSSVLFGMLPALAARKVDLRSAMAKRTLAGVGSFRLRQAFISGEVALVVLLLAASGLLIRTLYHLETLAPGFNPNGVMIGKASLDDVRFHDPGNFRKLLDESVAAMRQIPGVQNAAIGLTVPDERALNDMITISDGKEAGRQDGTDVIYVTPGYFQVLQMPVLAGRVFRDSDSPDSQHVAIVNLAFARRFYGGASPVGRYLNKDTVIVGEVADIAVSSGLHAGAPLMSEEAMYIPAAQVSANFLSMVHVWIQPDWIVRGEGPITGLTGSMQRALSSVDPDLPFSGFYSMRDLRNRTLVTQRIEVVLLGTMAALALLLSVVGIFALVANVVAQRTREIGIRMALGSSVSRAMVQIGGSGMLASAIGIVVGLILSAGTLRIMRGVLYGIAVYDVPTFVVIVCVLVSVTLLASTIPTLRIISIDPVQALREE